VAMQLPQNVIPSGGGTAEAHISQLRERTNMTSTQF
jgi:hypothetical protein